MTNDDHDHYRENIAAYALGALEPDEVAALERHIEECEGCRSELRWLAPAARSLPESVARLEPPRQLRRRLMDEVRADARAVAGDGARSIGQRPVSWKRRLGSDRLGWQPLAGLAVAALAVAGLVGYQLGSDGSGGNGETTTIVAGQAPGVTARMVREGDRGTLSLDNVKPLPQGRVLEAWVRRDGEVEPVPALFVPDSEGRAATTIADLKGVNTVMVTSEPNGGSEAPTSKPIVTVPIPQ
jgi:anti-sigma-K factor RskA